MSFFEELKRRNVVRVGIAYAVASWIILQATDVIGEILDLPEWGGKLILLMLAVGFVLALFFAWAYELTPEGLKRESEVDRSQSIAPKTGRKLDFAIIALLAVGLVYFIYEARFMDHDHSADRAAGDPIDAGSPVEVAQAPVTPPVAPVPESAKDRRTSIVVLPFVNMSADPEQEYFSDGLSEEILNALAQIEGLRVISRTSAFAFKGKDVAIPDIARQLDVSHVLEGSVRSAGDDVRITAQLIEVDTDSHLWSQAFSRKLENVFDIQLEISEAIANELQLRLSSDQATDRPTANMAAYEAYLRGRHRYQIRGDQDMEVAVDLFEEAVALDPEFDEAWANLAAAQAVLSFYANEGYRELAEQAVASANRAITIDPANGFGHAVLGLLAMGDFDFERAMSELDLAIRLNPNESNSYLWKAIALSNLGYNQQAAQVLDTAVSLDPVFANLHNWLVSVYLSTGDLELARHHAARFREINPNDVLNDPAGLASLAGDFAAAEARYREAWSEEPALQPIIEPLIRALRDPAAGPEAVEAIEALKTETWTDPRFPLLWRLGAIDEAIADFERLLQAGRGLRAVNNLSFTWRAFNRKYLAHPSVPAFYESHGLADYWRAHGAPDACRRVGDRFECGVAP